MSTSDQRSYVEMLGSDPLSKRKYRFRLVKSIATKIPHLAGHTDVISFRDGRGTEWAVIDRETLIVKEGYAWNGCTPKWWVGKPINRWFGTPDFPKVIIPSGFHDACYQFINTQHFPLIRRECDMLFHSLMDQRDFYLADFYYAAVREFGEGCATEEPRDGAHSFLLTHQPI